MTLTLIKFKLNFTAHATISYKVPLINFYLPIMNVKLTMNVNY